MTETAAQLAYREAYTQGATDILDSVRSSLIGLQWDVRGTSADSVASAIRLVEQVNAGVSDILRQILADQERQRAHREQVLSALPLVRTEEEVRKDRLRMDNQSDGGLAQALTACTHTIRRSPENPDPVECRGFGRHEYHSGTTTDGEWIFWISDGKILPTPVDSGQSEE